MSQSTIKMEKGYYTTNRNPKTNKKQSVAIHNKNGKGLLRGDRQMVGGKKHRVAIHNKNGKGLLQKEEQNRKNLYLTSQSTIKMEKGYYTTHPYCAVVYNCGSRNPQ